MASKSVRGGLNKAPEKQGPELKWLVHSASGYIRTENSILDELVCGSGKLQYSQYRFYEVPQVFGFFCPWPNSSPLSKIEEHFLFCLHCWLNTAWLVFPLTCPHFLFYCYAVQNKKQCSERDTGEGCRRLVGITSWLVVCFCSSLRLSHALKSP